MEMIDDRKGSEGVKMRARMDELVSGWVDG